jgi:hypothetical protein
MAERFTVVLSAAAKREINGFRVFEQRRILDSIAAKLTYDPNVEVGDKKCLKDGETADFAYEPPLWELKIGSIRVFYEVNPADKVVDVRAVRRKPPYKTTSEVLNEADGD